VNSRWNNKYFLLLSFLFLPILGSCTAITSKSDNLNESINLEKRDLSCSYFYFLWGTHAEYNNHFPEALEAYEKALVCDPTADYIKRKLPVLLIKKGDIEQAVSLLKQAIAQEPKDTAQRSLLARIFIQQKQEPLAIEQFEAIISYAPDNEQILLRLGILLTQTGDYDRAKHYLNDLLKLKPEAYFARLYLARIGQSQGDVLTAELEYYKALELNWSADLSYEIAEFHLRNKQYERSLAILEPILAKDENDERARLLKIQALLATDREEEALIELNIARDSSDAPEQLSMVLSRLYLRNGNNQKAEETLLSIIAQGANPESNPEASYLLALIFVESERYQKALKMLETIPLDSEVFEDAVLLQTRILRQTDRISEALVLFEKYLADDRTKKPLFYVMASSLLQERAQTVQALELLNRGIQDFPDDESLLFEYGLQLERSGRLEEAIRVMERILLINPDHAEALNFIGYSWADTNRNLEKALGYINRAMELKPGNGYIQDSLGWAYFRLGDLERAREELLGALVLLPDDPHIHDHLGDVYQALGLVEEARAAYKEAYEKFEDKEKKEAILQKIEALDAL